MRARVERKPPLVSSTPQPVLPAGLDSANIFRDRFANLDDEDWFNVLVRAMEAETVEDVRFPRYPPAELQNRIHGGSSREALSEAFEFYRFIKAHEYLSAKFSRDAYFLDFAAGWGRMSRAFLRHFDLNKTYSYEPNLAFCVIARSLNPYTCFLNGPHHPDKALPENRFDLVIGYSIFSHLSPEAAAVWLEEMARITRTNAYCVFTTWGGRFIDQMIADAKALARGKDIHWYTKACLAAAGDPEALKNRYRKGEFAWFSLNPGDAYGEAFLPPEALSSLLRAHDIPFDLVEFDQVKLAQDAFILRRRETVSTSRIRPAPAFANANALAHDAWAAMERRDWEGAAQLWEAVRTAAPDRGDGYIAGSHALRELRRIDEAETLTREAVARFPDNAEALTAHAWVAMSREDWGEALRRWDVARERFPDRSDVYIHPAYALWRSGRFGEAEAMSRDALRRFPDSSDALVQHAWIAMGQRNWAEALRRWATLRDRFPDIEDGHVRPIQALRGLRRLDEAETAAAEALARFPNSTAALIERILTVADRSDWQRVRTLMEGSRDQLLVNGNIHPELHWVENRLNAMTPPAAKPKTEAPSVDLEPSDKNRMLRLLLG